MNGASAVGHLTRGRVVTLTLVHQPSGCWDWLVFEDEASSSGARPHERDLHGVTGVRRGFASRDEAMLDGFAHIRQHWGGDVVVEEIDRG